MARDTGVDSRRRKTSIDRLKWRNAVVKAYRRLAIHVHHQITLIIVELNVMRKNHTFANYQLCVRQKHVLKCNVCGKTFNQRATLKSHALNHAQPGRFACRTCCAIFRCASDLEKHGVVHESSSPITIESSVSLPYSRDVGTFDGEGPLRDHWLKTEKELDISRHMTSNCHALQMAEMTR